MESKNEEKLENTTENNDRKGYFREYNKKRYENNKEILKKQKNTRNIRKKYNISTEYIERYGDDLYAIIKSKELLDSVEPSLVEQFFNIDYTQIDLIEF